MMPGEATYINLAPFGNGRYGLIIAGGKMLPVSGENNMAASVNGWFKPNVNLAAFLEKFSERGGTHHSALVYDVSPRQLAPLARYLGCECCII